MSRHFVIEMRVALPGQDDEEEEAAMKALMERISELPEFHDLNASVEEPYQV